MTKRTVHILLLVLLFLCGFVWWLSRERGVGEGQGRHRLFAEIAAEEIAGVRIEQGASSLELLLTEGVWTLPASGGYPADFGKIRSIILYKILDIWVSQVLPVDSEGMEGLGLTDEAVKRGRAKVLFFDKAGKEISGIYLGEYRTTQGSAKLPIPTGQYIRRSDRNEVFLIPETIGVVTTPVSWLESGIANILASKVRRVRQYVIDGTAEKLEFELLEAPEGDKVGLVLAGGMDAGQQYDLPAMSYVRAGLEDLTMVDVRRADADEIKVLSFDRRTVYEISNGLVYSVSTAKDKKLYAKLDVVFDEALSENPDSGKNPEKAQTASAASAQARPAASLPEPQNAASEEEALRLDSEYAPWVYILAEHQGAKFRSERGKFLKPIAKDEAAKDQKADGTAGDRD